MSDSWPLPRALDEGAFRDEVRAFATLLGPLLSSEPRAPATDAKETSSLPSRARWFWEELTLSLPGGSPVRRPRAKVAALPPSLAKKLPASIPSDRLVVVMRTQGAALSCADGTMRESRLIEVRRERDCFVVADFADQEDAPCFVVDKASPAEPVNDFPSYVQCVADALLRFALAGVPHVTLASGRVRSAARPLPTLVPELTSPAPGVFSLPARPSPLRIGNRIYPPYLASASFAELVAFIAALDPETPHWLDIPVERASVLLQRTWKLSDVAGLAPLHRLRASALTIPPGRVFAWDAPATHRRTTWAGEVKGHPVLVCRSDSAHAGLYNIVTTAEHLAPIEEWCRALGGTPLINDHQIARPRMP